MRSLELDVSRIDNPTYIELLYSQTVKSMFSFLFFRVGNLCHSEERSDEESRFHRQSTRFFAHGVYPELVEGVAQNDKRKSWL
jgi:hypothetical protein